MKNSTENEIEIESENTSENGEDGEDLSSSLSLNSNFNKKFKIFNDFPLCLDIKIKLYHIPSINYVLFATYDNNAYYYSEENGLKKIDELCNKQLIKFSCGDNVYMALTDDGVVYSWSDIYFAQTCDDKHSSHFLPLIGLLPLVNYHFITDICCGNKYSLLLTREGVVLELGFNVCIRSGSINYQPITAKMSTSNVMTISCGCSHSAALTRNGKVYVWGSNRWKQLGIAVKSKNDEVYKLYDPIEVNGPSIKQVMCGAFSTIMLTTHGDIYFCGSTQLIPHEAYSIPTKINFGLKFKEIAASLHTSLCVALSENNECYIFGKYGNEDKINVHKSVINTIDETYAYYECITYKTIAIQTTKYENSFIEISELGNGGFSAVYKSQHKLDKNYYAIKKVCFSSKQKDEVLKELVFLSNLKSDFVVKYFDSWIESNYYIGTYKDVKNICKLLLDNSNTNLLHIQMELCSLSLRDAINRLKNCLESDNTLTLVGYYIASELFYEILECVHYIHSHRKAIIHRDLKPENILITNFVRNRFVRLADFGLSTFHEFDDQSHTKYKGTARYRAPELSYTTNYTTKIDMFSLGMIMQELFNFKISDPDLNYERVLNRKMKFLKNLVIDLLSPVPERRPNCGEIMKRSDCWCLTKEEVLKDQQFNQILKIKANTIEENFNEYFIQKKYDIKTSNKNATMFAKLWSYLFK